MKNIFEKEVTEEVVARINALDAQSIPQWGKMSVDQMLAHCSVSYELVYENKHPKPKGIKKWMLKTLVKKVVVNEKPYKKNGMTAPEFLIADQKVFDQEKNRLIAYIKKTQELGENHFDGKESHSFGKLTSQEWNNMFYKHLNHHLTQFGV
ncbi:DUF1569 domain-containing protein [Brumimicrobium aurantiacum]|uniref:DUF1569 domain-containing protein n=1 Tax=Brumimicrobium aurantiacum TaxID=1737063 RepID=A0A3E1EW32_9FLAO|nr:DUF1569 domain-containing protein [Brumimicrobium aurantiacum]RFC53765.1 DUF1569 domain-containing protein [Brumimicrobium aurantiacum]